MARDPRAYLWDMREAATLVGQFVAGNSFDIYMADTMLRSAVERQMQNLGEALAQLSRVDSTLSARVGNHADIIGFRNILVHGYAALNHARVWETIQTDLPPLLVDLDRLLTELDPAGNP